MEITAKIIYLKTVIISEGPAKTGVLKGQYIVTINRAWNRSASFRFTQ